MSNFSRNVHSSSRNGWPPVSRTFAGMLTICLIAGVSLGSLPSQAQDTSSVDTQPQAWQPENLLQLPAAARQAVQTIRPSLVTVESFGGSTTQAGVIGGIRTQGEGNTTGVLISEDGWILTSRFNFIDQPRSVSVVTSDGGRFMAKIHAEDMTRNLCLLKIQREPDQEAVKWQPASTVPADRVQVGRFAISVGLGYGDTQPAISIGIISALNRIYGRALQTDANISPANYGGPLIDMHGRMYGICVPLSPEGMSAAAGTQWYDSGIGFVIPTTQDDAWLETLKQGQGIYPASLGVTVQETENGEGLQVHRVVSGFPAAKAKIVRDSILWEADQVPLSRQADLISLIRRKTAGNSIKLVYSLPDKPDERLSAEVTLDRHPDSLPKSLIPGLPPLEELR